MRQKREPKNQSKYKLARGKRPIVHGYLEFIGWNEDRTPQYQIFVWCPYCARWHIHGWHSPATGGFAEWHSLHGHCWSDWNPFVKSGYWITPVPKRIMNWLHEDDASKDFPDRILRYRRRRR